MNGGKDGGREAETRGRDEGEVSKVSPAHGALRLLLWSRQREQEEETVAERERGGVDRTVNTRRTAQSLLQQIIHAMI